MAPLDDQLWMPLLRDVTAAYLIKLDIGVDGYGTPQTDKKGCAIAVAVVTCSSRRSWCSYKEEKISLCLEVEQIY